MIPLTLRTRAVAVVAALYFGAPVVAQEVGPLTTFTNGTKTNADEVNANFSAVKGAVNNNHGRVVNLESAVSTHSNDIGDIKSKDAAQDTSIGTLTSSSTDHENRLKAVEGTNDTQTVNINLLGNTVGDHTTNLGTLNSTVGTHTTEIGGVKAKNVEQDGNIGSLSSTVGDHTTSIDKLTPLVNGHTSKIDTLTTTDEVHKQLLQSIDTTNQDQSSRLDGHATQLNLLGSTYGNLIPNWTFVHGTEGWTELSGSGQFLIADTPGGPAGEKSLSNATNSAPRISSTQLIPIDQNQTYRVTGTVRLQMLSGEGGVSIGVRLFDATRNSIPGDLNDIWYLPLRGALYAVPTPWIHIEAFFGFGTSHSFPPNARYATVATILNLAGNKAGSNVYNVQGLGIYLAERPKSWTNLTLGTGIVPYGAPYQAPQYRLVGDEVCLRGLVKSSGVIGAGAVLGVLPTGYRPPAQLTFPVVGFTTPARTDVWTNGDVKVNQPNGTQISGLDGICFSLTP